MKGMHFPYLSLESVTQFGTDGKNDAVRIIILGMFCGILLVLISGCAVPDIETPLNNASGQEQDNQSPYERVEANGATEDLPSPSPETDRGVMTKEIGIPKEIDTPQNSDLPDEIKTKVLQAIATDLDIAEEELIVESVSAQTWPNGCLGLAKPDEFCTMALVNGWQIIVSPSNEPAIAYRTNTNGTAVRRAN